MNSKRTSRICQLLLSLVLVPALSSAMAADLGSAGDPSSQTITLRQVDVSFSVENYGLPTTTRTSPFTNETGLATANVRRGTLIIAGGLLELPFAWDRDNAKLVLDLDRNGNLGDDPEGTATSKMRGSYQTFNGLRIPVETSNGVQRVLLDINCYVSRSDLHVMAGLRSFWEGKITLQGRDWQIGLIENLEHKPGSLSQASMALRPWADRDKAFSVGDGTPTAFKLVDSLYLNGRMYRVRCAFSRQGEAPEARLEVSPIDARLGELAVEGQHISRLLLVGESGSKPFAVLLYGPARRVNVPVGDYHECRLALGAGSVEALRDRTDPFHQGRQKLFSVGPDRPAALSGGGPLTNVVSAGQRGQIVEFNYSLVGALGEKYRLTGGRQNPTFTVYRDGKQIHSGKFEFG